MGNLIDIRGEVVMQLRAAIKEGTYHIDSQKIALKIIKEALLNQLW
jgi:anti-sigma28 factor (negative regulator of flagellin synthesis)